MKYFDRIIVLRNRDYYVKMLADKQRIFLLSSSFQNEQVEHHSIFQIFLIVEKVN